MNLVDDIRARNWTQGSFVDFSPADRNEYNLPLEPAQFVVASHPCDVVAGRIEQEPFVDLIPSCITKSLDGNLTFGKNPRKLQLTRERGHYEFDLVGRRVLDRSVLASRDPSDVLNEADRRIFAAWLASRYSRPAFADEFNRRTANSSKQIQRILKSSGGKVSGIYVGTTLAELAAGEDYDLVVAIAMRGEDFERPVDWATVSQAVDAIGDALRHATGINLVDCLLVSESEMTLEALRVYARWDYDSLSYKVGDFETVSISP